MSTKELLPERKGIYGFGFSSNSELDLMNLVVLAVAGIIVKIFFEENFTKLGSSGPASTTIWGYGLTAISLILMTFMGFYLTNNHKGLFEGDDDVFSYFMSILTSDAVPVMFTLGIVLYIISLNFIYFKRINSNKVSSSYSTYSFFSSLLIIIQIGIIIKYMFSILKTIKYDQNRSNPEKNKEHAILKGASIIATSINFIFILILHILLAFFSTDG